MCEPFSTAIIDPPWPYEKTGEHKKLSGYVQKEYETLSVESLKALPIGEVISKYIFLWTTGPFVGEGLDVLKSWGFEYKTQLVWYKTNGLGVGYWFRGDHEIVLVAKKHGAPSVRTNERSVFKSKRLGHSKKPEYIHRVAEKLFPGPYIEIFGRQSRDGWTVLGNEAPGDGRDIRQSLRLLLESPDAVKFNVQPSRQQELIIL